MMKTEKIRGNPFLWQGICVQRKQTRF